MKKIIARFVCISMLCSLLVGCGGNNGAGSQNDTPIKTEVEDKDADDKEVKIRTAKDIQTEENFYEMVKEIMGKKEQSDTLSCNGYDNNQAYLFILERFASNEEKKAFAKAVKEKKKYSSSVLELEYKEQSDPQMATLLLKFKNREGRPEYTIIFKK